LSQRLLKFQDKIFDKIVDVGVRAQRVHFRERAQTVPINTILKKNTISAVQKRRFYESSVQLANMVVEHEQLKAESISLRERVGMRGNMGGLSGVNASAQENERLKRMIYELESSLRQKETERNRLRQTSSTAADVEVIQQVDSQDVPRLQAHIQRVRAENENLRRITARGTFGSQRTQVGTRVSHQDVRREAPVRMAGAGGYVSTGRAVSSGPTIRRSAGYATTSTVVGAPATTYLNQGQTVYPGGGVIRTSQSNTQVVRTSGGYGNTTYVGGGSPSTGVITTGAYPTTGVISSTGVRTSGGYTTGVSPGYTTTVGGAGGVIRRSGTHTTNVVNTGIPTNTFVNRY